MDAGHQVSMKSFPFNDIFPIDPLTPIILTHRYRKGKCPTSAPTKKNLSAVGIRLKVGSITSPVFGQSQSRCGNWLVINQPPPAHRPQRKNLGDVVTRSNVSRGDVVETRLRTRRHPPLRLFYERIFLHRLVTGRATNCEKNSGYLPNG